MSAKAIFPLLCPNSRNPWLQYQGPQIVPTGPEKVMPKEPQRGMDAGNETLHVGGLTIARITHDHVLLIVVDFKLEIADQVWDLRIVELQEEGYRRVNSSRRAGPVNTGEGEGRG